ncbi:protein SHQ1 homolog isoform X2 [Harpegnathos saltator]|uniref:Protein SHQ1 homolog n=1 Tax=Harpegnathos saltator TaxID=610380 RepID=E2C289_HARSA|nr:protein SHQ1 homolog isoform X2 [Harpegnathos saltator]EFN77936.1 Protein SHQ1-like protein [Harpegnathos saltator]
MLTPRFEITQTETEVIIVIHAPYTNIKTTEVYVDGTDFRFYSTPYFLRLKLPGEIEENDSSSGSYDCEKGYFTLKLSKVNKGEYFENLDMITIFLEPPKKHNIIAPSIEVIGNPSTSSADIDGNLQNITDVDMSSGADSGDIWFIPQKQAVENITLLTNSPKYGFANKISGALSAFEPVWIKDIIDLPTPDITPEIERKTLRQLHEDKDFNEDHYLADYFEPEWTEHIAYVAEWDTLQKDQIMFNEVEVDLLKELPNKEYLLEAEDIQKLCLNLVDILYANCYNRRTTLGENTVESGWTINKLSSTLCWFQNFTSMDEVIIACFRRSLCYPLYRNWELSMKVFEDVKKVVKLGKKYIIKCFCEIHSIFNTSYAPRYILNQLYIKDFLIWLQKCPDSLIESLQTILDNVYPDKVNMEFGLVKLEAEGHTVHKELIIANTIYEATEQINALALEDEEEEKSRLSSSSSSSTDSTDTDYETDSGNYLTRTTTSSSDSTSSVSDLDSDDFSNPKSDSENGVLNEH